MQSIEQRESNVSRGKEKNRKERKGEDPLMGRGDKVHNKTIQDFNGSLTSS